MTGKEVELFDKRRDQYFIEEYGPLCLAAGCDIAQLSGPGGFFLSNAIRSAVSRHTEYVVRDGPYRIRRLPWRGQAHDGSGAARAARKNRGVGRHRARRV